MKSKSKWLWLVAVIAVGLAAIACDNGTNTTPIPCANGHSFTEWEETTAATCLDAAVNTEKCDVCGALGTVTDEGHHALGHSAGEAGGATEATCEDDGYTGTGICIRCSTELTGEVIDAFGHDYHDWTDSACTASGTSTRECTNDCGTVDTRSVGIGHDHGTSGTGSLICKREHCDHQYAIGDEGPAGGRIFYVADDTDGRPDGITIQGYTGATGTFAAYTAYYLEAAPANASGSTMRWSNTNVLILNLSQNSSETIDRAIGRGRLNTALIATAHSDDTVANNAAKAAAAYTNGGKTDWFLPSIEELNQMYIQISHVGMTANYFWSSSQDNYFDAWRQHFGFGNQSTNAKSSNFSVRAIRAF